MKTLIAILMLCFVTVSAIAAEPNVVQYLPNSTKKVCQLTGDLDRSTGKPTLNQTDKRFGIWGTDLGSSFEHKGKLYFLFGDTIGRPGDRDVLAWTESKDPARIQLNVFEADDKKWLPLTIPGVSLGIFEVPSAGISLDNSMYIACTTDHTKSKTMGRSILACSKDDGKTLTKVSDISNSKFINISIVKWDDWLYFYGSGDYRKSNVTLARVPCKQIEDRSKWEYFTGINETTPKWSAHEKDAKELFNQPQVGEFSVEYLKPLKKYVMLYNAEKPRGIIMRSSDNPWGPWSEATVIFEPWRESGYGSFMHALPNSKTKKDSLHDPKREGEWGGEYGPYLMGRYTTTVEGHCRIYFTMSTWNPYQVVVMQSDLKLVPAQQSDNRKTP